MADEKNTGKGATTPAADKPAAQRGQYTVLEQITVDVPVQGEMVEGADAPAPVATKVFVVRGDVSARSKNDAIRTAFNEQKISGEGTYAAVTSRSFAPVEVKPQTRTALTWG